MINTQVIGPVETQKHPFTYSDGGAGLIEYMPGGLKSDRPLVIIVPGIMSTMDD